MTIVLDENAWAEEAIRYRVLGNKPSETMRRVARYYLDKSYSKKDVRKMLDIFLLQCDPSASLPKWSESLDKSMRYALDRPAIKIDRIDITCSEMFKISELKNVQERRLAFTLLCLAKYWHAVNPASNYWVNNEDSAIMRMANVNTSLRRQSQMFHNLNEAGLIQFSKKVDNTSVRVCFVDENDDIGVAASVTDFEDLGHQYMLYCGDTNYFWCKQCGAAVRRTRVDTRDGTPKSGRPQSYCKRCATDIRIQRRVNATMSAAAADLSPHQ